MGFGTLFTHLKRINSLVIALGLKLPHSMNIESKLIFLGQ